MGVKVATACFQWSQPIVPHSSCYSQTLASIISSPSSARRSRRDGGASTCRYVHTLGRPALFGTPLTKFNRSRSCCSFKPRTQTIKRACSANLDAFSDEEFSEQIQELALRFQTSAGNIFDDDDEDTESVSDSMKNHELNSVGGSVQNQMQITTQFVSTEPPWSEIHREPPEWTRDHERIPDEIKRKANSVELPLSLRILKRKMQWHDGIRDARETAYCSVKKAFSSMVFMIRELHSYSLKLREILFYEDLEGILNRVEKEIHASFVWLFQQVFSHTPTLMVYVMILLANFTVHSMGNNSAIAASSSRNPFAAPQTAEVIQFENHKVQKFDSSTIKTFSISSSSGKTTSIGGGNGGSGGGKIPPVASGTDGDELFDRSVNYPTVMPDGASQLSSVRTSAEAESISEENTTDEELSQWNAMVEEASEMQAAATNEVLDHDTMRRFVSPVTAKIEPDDYTEYFRTELLYQMGLSQDPNNPLLLANYAQFLYLVAHDFDRAEDYFKKAVGVKPPDAEALNKYATFLWRVRKDLWAAEETFLEAISASADPSNSFYAANYAHFLWNSGAEDTCFPTASPASDSIQGA